MEKLLAIQPCHRRLTKEGLYLRRFLTELGLEVKTLQIYCDNQGVLELSKNPVNHHFAREEVEDGEVVVKHTPSIHMPTNGFTKPTERATLLKLCAASGIKTLDVG